MLDEIASDGAMIEKPQVRLEEEVTRVYGNTLDLKMI